MSIDFTANDHPTVGAEMELHIVDLPTGELVPATSGLLDELRPASPAAGDTEPTEFEHPRIKHELFESTVELISEVCETAGDVGADLAVTLGQVLNAARPHELGLMGAGTHPFALLRDAAISPDPRYHRLLDEMQWTLRRLAVCGLHVHVAVRDGDRAIRIMNEMTRYLPHLLAMSSSSPFFEGEDSGLASTRIKLFEMLPNSGLPPALHDWAEFEGLMHTLTDAGVIRSVKDVWWSIRPQPTFGTIEIRICDTPSSLDDLVAIVAFAQALVAWIDERIDADELPAPPPRWMTSENLWLGTRYGTDAELVTDEEGPRRRRPVGELVAEVADRAGDAAARIGVETELASAVALFERGSSALRQRECVADGGTLLDVVRSLAAELSDPVPA